MTDLLDIRPNCRHNHMLGGMRARTKARLLALLILSILLGLGLSFAAYSYAVSLGAMGKKAYLQHEERQFDRLYAQPRRLFTDRSFVTHCAETGLYLAAFIGLYELLALGIYKVIGPDKTEGDGTPTT
jgi:hypothetical protein